MKILKGRVLIKKLDGAYKTKHGLEIPDDLTDSFPKAKIILLAKDVEGIVEIGDMVYYMEPREKGRCKYKGEEHFIVSIANIVAII